MKKQFDFMSSVDYKAIFTALVISVAAYSFLVIAQRGLGIAQVRAGEYIQTTLFTVSRAGVSGVAFYLTGFLSALFSRSQNRSSGLMNACVGLCLFHIISSLILPFISNRIQPELFPIMNAPYYFLKSFFIVLAGWGLGIYGALRGVKYEQELFYPKVEREEKEEKAEKRGKEQQLTYEDFLSH